MGTGGARGTRSGLESGAMGFDIDPLDRQRARAEARARLFASPERVTLGRYRLIERIGSGAWGTVYRAIDPLMGRAVAVKVMHGPADERPGPIARWRREAQLLAKLDHPHVIGVYDVGVDDGRAYLVTELVHRGRTLTRWLADRPRDLLDVVRRFIPLADALSAVHACGVLHRDIKPDNILVDAAGALRLADFGLAAERRDLERADGSMGFEGTPAFVPPEVRHGAVPDQRSDLYSLCGSLWFAVCGTPPTPTTRGSPPRPLRRFFEIGLAHQPEHRFPTAHALGRALEVAAGDGRVGPRFLASLGLGLVVAVGTLVGAPPRPPAHEARDPGSQAALALALGTARRLGGANEGAAHILESAFFRASALGEADVASRAALERFEVAAETGDRWGAEFWEPEANVWLARRSSPEPDLALRFATARSRSLALQGRPRDALEALPEPASVRGSCSPSVTIAFLFQRGELLNLQGESAAGLRAFEAAHALAKRHFPRQHALRRSARWNLAATQFERGDFDAAAEGFEALLHAADGSPPPPRHEVAELERNLGAAYFELGDVQRATSHTEAALEASLAEYGEAHPRTLDTLQNLAAMLYVGGQRDAAKATAWRAILATEEAYGPDDPRLASMLSNLAVMNTTAEGAADAEVLLRRAADIVQTHRGPAHRELGSIQANLAEVLALQGDPAGALEAATGALEIYEAALGPDHPELAEVLLQLATLHLESGRLSVARTHALRLRALGSVDMARRARAAFILGQLDAVEQPPRSPHAWLTVASAELAQSSENADSQFAQTLVRWQSDWRSAARALRVPH